MSKRQTARRLLSTYLGLDKDLDWDSLEEIGSIADLIIDAAVEEATATMKEEMMDKTVDFNPSPRDELPSSQWLRHFVDVIHKRQDDVVKAFGTSAINSAVEPVVRQKSVTLLQETWDALEKLENYYGCSYEGIIATLIDDEYDRMVRHSRTT